MKEVADFRSIRSRNAQLLAHFLVMEFGQGLGGFYTQAMQVEIFGVFTAFEESLRFQTGRGADRGEGR